MTPLSKKELEEVRERAEKATPGPWISGKYSGLSEDHRMVLIPNENMDAAVGVAMTCGTMGGDFRADAEFIAHSREDVERLLETIEHLKKYQQHLPKCAKWFWSGVRRDDDGFAGIGLSLDESKSCTCGLIEKEG